MIEVWHKPPFSDNKVPADGRKAGSSWFGGRCERLKGACAGRRALNLSSLRLLLKREFLSLVDVQPYLPDEGFIDSKSLFSYHKNMGLIIKKLRVAGDKGERRLQVLFDTGAGASF